jgi:hypothetical protein
VPVRLRMLWLAFIRLLIVLLIAVLGLVLILAFNPGALRAIVALVPGIVEMPVFGSRSPVPVINVPQGHLPGGFRAFTGWFSGISISCGFLMELEDGRVVGVTAAHATAPLPRGIPAEFYAPDGVLMASLKGQIGRGQTFRQDHLSFDYVLWAVAENTDPMLFLKADLRYQGQPGEGVVVIGWPSDGAGGSIHWPGVVMKVTPEATWIQLEGSFEPAGYSGCPVVSQYTGRLIGMAVVGANRPPVIMGLHPVGSLLEKARTALASP